VDGYSGDAGDALAATEATAALANGMMFTTLDSDNDYHPNENCATTSGWWYRYCTRSVINHDANGMWVTDNLLSDVQSSRILLKLN